MSTELEQRLRDAFHEDAQRAHLLNPDTPPAPDARPLTTITDRRRTVRKLVAVAAVIALLAWVAAVTLLDDDQQVDTVPVTETPLPRMTVQALAGRTIASGSGCPFGISGDPVDMQPGPAGERFSPEGGQGVAHILFGSLSAEVHVPAFDHGVGDWREEPVDLGGRPGIVWLDGPESASRDGAGNIPFVQARYAPDTDEPCSSFSVTVDGGTEEANRQAAVDLAARILLPSEMADLDLPGAEGGPVAGLELPGTTWQMTTQVGSFVTPAEMTFTDTTVTWDDGCATVTADYELDRDEGYLVLTNKRSSDPGCTPPTHPEFTLGWPAVAAVMGNDRIEVDLFDGVLYLGGIFGTEQLILGPPPPDPTQPPALPDPGEQPPDAAGAEDAVRTAFVTLYDATLPVEERAPFVDRPEVWIPAAQALRAGQYGEDVKDLRAEVEDVVFTSPTHAAVLFRVLASSQLVPQGYQLGDAILVDGRWVVDVVTPCRGMSIASVSCDYTP
jgi:hypothetical protein